MKDDLEMVVHKFPNDMGQINIYPIGDLHIGSSLFHQEIWEYWKKTVLNDPIGYVVIVGDMMENGLKTSKTNSYEATMQPFEQKEWLKSELACISHKIIGCVGGNHEYRSTKESHDHPLYDVMCKFNKEDFYRENMVFMKLNLGERRRDRQVSYGLVFTHGATVKKAEDFAYVVDGMDVFISGHTHKAKTEFPAKLVMDMQNEVIRQVCMTSIVVPSFTSYGGYGMRGLYKPNGCIKIPVITLNGYEKDVEVVWI